MVLICSCCRKYFVIIFKAIIFIIINITGDARPTGVLGLKKAEKDLIMRRYKYNHQMSDSIQRVALIYGQPPTQSQNQMSASGISNNNLSTSPYSYNLNSQYINNPYLNSQSTASGVNSNLSGIIKRNKYILDESGSGSQIRLPRIQSLGRHQQQESSGAQISKLLPPIGNQPQNLNGIVINKVNAGIPPVYNQYILKPTKLKNITKPMLSSGVSGEKMQLNNPASQYKSLNLHNQSNASNSTALSNVINIENQKNALNLNGNSSLIGKGSNLATGISRGSYGSSPPMVSGLSPQIEINSQANGGGSEIKKIIKKRRVNNDSNNQNTNAGLVVQ